MSNLPWIQMLHSHININICMCQIYGSNKMTSNLYEVFFRRKKKQQQIRLFKWLKSFSLFYYHHSFSQLSHILIRIKCNLIDKLCATSINKNDCTISFITRYYLDSVSLSILFIRFWFRCYSCIHTMQSVL